jgi:hypothetical protein
MSLRALVTSDRIEIFREREPIRPVVVQHAAADRRPFIHPIVAPDGRGELTEDAPPHHPWQHGLYVGLNDVNGVGFWTEGLLPTNAPTDGTIHPQFAWASVHPDGSAATWHIASDWRGPDGATILEEAQSWTLHDRGDAYVLDLAWRLRAAGGADIRFGRYAYGGLFLRMPFRRETGGRVVDSEGRVNAASEQRRARWVAVSMSVPGRAPDDPVGVAILDHPANAGHPTPWRVDHELGIGPARCIAGPWTLGAGASATSRYRLLVHTGPTDPDAVEAEWRAFTREPGRDDP